MVPNGKWKASLSSREFYLLCIQEGTNDDKEGKAIGVEAAIYVLIMARARRGNRATKCQERDRANSREHRRRVTAGDETAYWKSFAVA